MIALVVSVLITFYLIIPETIFRFIFGSFVPTRNFVITGTETAKRAVVVALIPFSVALLLCWYVPLTQKWPFPVANNTAQSRRIDYKIVAAGLYSDTEFAKSKEAFWQALTPSLRRQARLVIWYLLLVALEAYICGKLALNFARYKNKPLPKYLADTFLFPFISEWHPLLTPYLLPNTKVKADLLCTNNTLYEGRVAQHFLRDGQLSGIILSDPRRFDREQYLVAKAKYLEAKDALPKPDKENFWVKIPSASMYFFADKIFNMNLTYVTDSGEALDPTEALQRYIESELGVSIKGLSNISVNLNLKKKDDSTDANKNKPEGHAPDLG